MSLVKILLFFYLVSSLTVVAQNVSGIVYNQKSTVANIEITNLSNQTKTISNQDGEFSISASVGDTLSVNSIFYQPKKITLKSIHTADILIIELKKITNEIDPVLIVDDNYSANKSFEKNETTFHSQLQEDIKQNPYKYGPPPSANVNFVAIFNLIGKLFKKTPKASKEYVRFEDLNSLFSETEFFNQQLLFKELNIPSDYTSLFFEYCAVQKIDKQLITENRDLELLDVLLKHSESFLKLLQDVHAKQKD